MASPSGLRDSTQIVLPWASLDGVQADLEAEFTVTVYDEGNAARIIGSPVVIKEVSEYLVRQGISLP
ncbi:hypothetical protein GJ631_15375 [Natronomonas sp. CBA1123]|jgi:hypothetical protein|uniref:VNG_1110C family protein n=1 Tax=Natronomonas sp. CBA1123 TaxID=2668070 RepID=UPI0012EABE73|nr:hypothetical protein [Natronomonas sp. CBA1123]MUV87894.1 hypothetical protein [Natronomonas sp. CBA1123]